MTLPVIDISPFLMKDGHASDRAQAASAIHAACVSTGFFYITGHGISEEAIADLHRLSTQFFALPLEEKMRISMDRHGRAWRGYFPLGGELTSGQPDRKEGIYLGTDLDDTHPSVMAGLPMHGRNPALGQPEGFQRAVGRYMELGEHAGHAVMRGIARSLGLDEGYFHQRYTAHPLLLFRIFHYPAQPAGDAGWGVGEHTDYGLLTLLLQDSNGGLQVRSAGRWIDAPPIPGTLVCNIGDMLDRMTRGLYRSTPHRVRNTSGRDRLSFPLFFDPAFEAPISPIEGLPEAANDASSRWDSENVHDFEGTYGQYLLRKVGRVFPALGGQLL